MVAALRKARPQDVALMPQAFVAAPDRQAQGGQIRTAAIAQLDPLEVVPQPLSRIELWGVAGHLLQMPAFGGASGEEVLDRLAAMDRRPISNDEQRATDLAQQQAQEADNIRASSRRAPGSA
jgi:hypothetical protein